MLKVIYLLIYSFIEQQRALKQRRKGSVYNWLIIVVPLIVLIISYSQWLFAGPSGEWISLFAGRKLFRKWLGAR